MKQIFFSTLFVFPIFIFAQPVFEVAGASAWATGTTSAAARNVFSVCNNPAGMVNETAPEIAIYSSRQFNESKLTRSCLVLLIPNKRIHFGISLNQYGYALFHQQKFGISLAKKLSDNFSAGITVSYFNNHVEEQPSFGNLLGEAGLQYRILKKIRLGVFVFNVTQSRYSPGSYDRIPTFVKLGCSYLISDKLESFMEVREELTKPQTISIGMNYKIHPVFALLVGATGVPMRFTCGTIINVKKLNVEFAMVTHEVLGLTPHLSLSMPLHK